MPLFLAEPPQKPLIPLLCIILSVTLDSFHESTFASLFAYLHAYCSLSYDGWPFFYPVFTISNSCGPPGLSKIFLTLLTEQVNVVND